MTLIQFIAVGIGGALGSIGRYVTIRTIDERVQQLFPYGTLLVNILGSLALGFIYGAALRKGGIDENWKLFLGTGLCGGFTTFSAFALENFNLLPQKSYLALIYILASVVGGILAVAAGYWLAKTSLS